MIQEKDVTAIIESSSLSGGDAAVVRSNEWKAVPDIWRSSAEKYGDKVALVDPYHDPPLKLTYNQVGFLAFLVLFSYKQRRIIRRYFFSFLLELSHETYLFNDLEALYCSQQARLIKHLFFGERQKKSFILFTLFSVGTRDFGLCSRITCCWSEIR